MADMANIVVYDDSATPALFTFVPHQANPEPLWVESSAVKSAVAKSRMTNSRVVQKNKVSRRQFKVEMPVMEQASGGNLGGFIAPPTVAHTVVVQLSVFAHERATETDVANALKMLINGVMGDTAAGTGSAFVNATNAGRRFLIGDILPG